MLIFNKLIREIDLLNNYIWQWNVKNLRLWSLDYGGHELIMMDLSGFACSNNDRCDQNLGWPRPGPARSPYNILCRLGTSGYKTANILQKMDKMGKARGRIWSKSNYISYGRYQLDRINGEEIHDPKQNARLPVNTIMQHIGLDSQPG